MLKTMLAACVFSVTLLFGAISVQAPPSLAMWLVDSYPDFFQMPYPKWAHEHSVMDRLVVRLVAYKLSRDWVTSAKARIGVSDREDIVAVVKASRRYLNSQFVNQRQIRHKPIDLPTYARLVYGMAWCDGQNHLFSMILGEFFDDVHTFSLFDKTTGLSPHTMAVIIKNKMPIYVDAWSDVPIFKMDEQRGSVNDNIPTWSEVQSDITLQQMDGTTSLKSVLTRDIYENGEKSIPAKKMLVPIGIFGNWKDQNVAPTVENSAFQTYLKGRIYHLYNHFASARNYYETVVNSPELSNAHQRGAEWFLQNMAD